jgi:hypothetical protein
MEFALLYFALRDVGLRALSKIDLDRRLKPIASGKRKLISVSCDGDKKG